MSSATTAIPAVPPTPATAALLDRNTRVSLYGEFQEYWQGTFAEFINGTRIDPALVHAALAPAKGEFTVSLGALSGMYPQHWRPLPSYGLPLSFVLKRTHYYQDQQTGHAYTDGKKLPSTHWQRGGPVKATLCKSMRDLPLVVLQTGFGLDAEYTPAHLRQIAATLVMIAEDAERHPMGKRSYYRSERGYDAQPGNTTMSQPGGQTHE